MPIKPSEAVDSAAREHFTYQVAYQYPECVSCISRKKNDCLSSPRMGCALAGGVYLTQAAW